MTKRKPSRARELGITDAEYERLLAAQGGHCALCPATPSTEHRRRVWKCRYCKSPGNAKESATCWNCGRARPKPPRFHSDHDHATGRVRGLLCYVCNRFLPASRDAAWHRRAAYYLDGGGPV